MKKGGKKKKKIKKENQDRRLDRYNGRARCWTRLTSTALTTTRIGMVRYLAIGLAAQSVDSRLSVAGAQAL
jgi:hypothetical protein